MNLSGSIDRIKKLIRYTKRHWPLKIVKNEEGIQIKVEDTSFNPTKDEHSDRAYVVNVQGMDSTAYEAEEYPDDLLLKYDDKHTAITSKPLVIEGNRFYFTKPNFLGTMALNQDTLLSGDIYQPSKGTYRRKMSKDINFEKLDINPEKEAVEEHEDHYIVKSDDIGDVQALHGSKKTQKEMNKAKRLRKLLKPSSVDRSKLIMAVVAGISVGFVLYPRVMNQ